jgi:hypothetical protein
MHQRGSGLLLNTPTWRMSNLPGTLKTWHVKSPVLHCWLRVQKIELPLLNKFTTCRSRFCKIISRYAQPRQPTAELNGCCFASVDTHSHTHTHTHTLTLTRKKCEVVVIPNAAHMVTLEAPASWRETTISFLDN